MPGFKTINNTSEIILNNKWIPATKFNSKDRLVDEKGNRVSADYKGRQYRIIEKRERNFSGLERFGRGFLGTLAVVCTLCLALFSKSVRNLFTKSKENVRFAVLEPSAPPISQPSNSPLDQDISNKASDAKISEPTKEAKNIAATKIQSLCRGHLARSAFKNLKVEHEVGVKKEVESKPKESPHSVITVTAQNVESVRQQVLVSPSLTEKLSQPSEKSHPPISPGDEIQVKNSEAISSHNEEVRPPLIDKEAEPLSLEKFKKDLKYFDIFNKYDKKLQAIAEELFKIAPKTLELTEIAHLIFEQCSKGKILLLLNAILFKHPSFTLSPYDKIRIAIIKDEGHALNNSWLIALLKEHALEEDEEELTACYDLAYRLNHPYIYRLSQTPILSSDYNLNFLWVNLNPQDRIKDVAQNIFGDGLNSFENEDCIKDPKVLRDFEKNEESLEKEHLENWKNIKKSFAYRISKWADVNPGAQINLWYDSALVTQKAQQKTFEMMKSISESRRVNLKLRDIRQLSNISDEIGNSLHPGTQVYYRVDILKALIADHMISSKESPKYCVVSDIDVQPMFPQQMLDQRTVDYLSSNGYVFNRVSSYGKFENSFFIFNKESENLKKVHHETIIEGTAFNIALLRTYPIEQEFGSERILDAQFVFNQYSNFRKEMEELDDELAYPRKVVKCPESQFNFGGNFTKSDYQKETFRFIGNSNIPYTINGRSCQNSSERQIEELINWKAEPLLLVE